VTDRASESSRTMPGSVARSLGRVVVASNNAGKLREFAALLGDAGIALVAQGELGVPEAEEPHPTFIENALAKARHAATLTGMPALADDSGLCVHALGGAPGVLGTPPADEPDGVWDVPPPLHAAAAPSIPSGA